MPIPPRGPRVYLAGPISGLDFAGCTGWRDDVSSALAEDGIVCFSPMRRKNYLAAEGKIEQSYSHSALSTDRGIMTRDHNDVISSDLVFVNLLGATERVSIGTVMEIAWAWDRKIPVVLVMEPERANLHDHPMIREAIGFRAATLAEGIGYAQSILNPN